jgi:glutamate--cysteine ligase catalytic subunit
MEVQMTDFENAAFTCVTVLLSRVILFFDLNLYVPLSLVEENFVRARVRDAVKTQKFHFRRHLSPLVEAAGQAAGASSAATLELTLAEIMLGVAPGATDAEFCGLLPLIFVYLDLIHCDKATREAVEQ